MESCAPGLAGIIFFLFPLIRKIIPKVKGRVNFLYWKKNPACQSWDTFLFVSLLSTFKTFVLREIVLRERERERESERERERERYSVSETNVQKKEKWNEEEEEESEI